MADRGTIPSLDGLRAVSIILVVVSHCGLGHIVPGGLGVTVFFFLSGYLISTLMLAEWRSTGTINVGHFYARRAFRLVPPLLVTLAIAYALNAAGLLPGSTSWLGFLSQLFYLANYYLIFSDNFGQIPYGTAVLWSLAVEEHFYIFFPVTMLLLLRRFPSLGQVVALFAGLCLVVLLWRLHLASLPGLPEGRITYGTDTRVDSILFGCILALGLNPIAARGKGGSMRPVHWAVLAGCLGLLALSIAIRNPHFRDTYRYTMQGVALAPIFYLAIRFAGDWLFRPLNSAAMAKIGVWSYSIYLIHHVAAAALLAQMPWLEARPVVFIPLVMAVSVGYAVLIDNLVDPYFRELRRRFRHGTPRPHIESPGQVALRG